MIKLKRIYERPSKEDGIRILVERLWPRGLTKAQTGINLWLKDAAPSPELRKWFNHEPEKWDEFCNRYWNELKIKKDAIKKLKQYTKKNDVTLVYAARDDKHNNALALKEFLEKNKQ
ncbi:MAG: DUF488 domain-containing protein [Nitrospirae bacterium]|nr:DUF488 domain-containing protein [Nitrospirota bacterium]